MSIVRPTQNHLLDALPGEFFERLSTHLHPVPLSLGQVLYDSGSYLHDAYFPVTSIVSFLYVMADGTPTEVTSVGHEGVIGLSLILGCETVLCRVVVQTAGHAYRLAGSILKAEFNRGEALQRLLLQYTYVRFTQMAQATICNRRHTVDQQLCRRLLLNLDRLSSNEIILTQELLANMMGVRREGVTEAAGNLQRAGLIRYRHGRITVLDRAGLEARACECYAAVKKECGRLLPLPQAW
jgi:CRP-like cAMP-binding protein